MIFFIVLLFPLVFVYCYDGPHVHIRDVDDDKKGNWVPLNGQMDHEYDKGKPVRPDWWSFWPDAVDRELPLAASPEQALARAKDDAPIMVLMASFRDPRCGQTACHAFERASNPSRVFVGVVDQVLPDDEHCKEIFCQCARERLSKLIPVDSHDVDRDCPFNHHFHLHLIDARQSQGPIVARSHHARQVQDRDPAFCLQVDAHSDFRDNWDREIIREWASTDNEYAVLSTYVHDVSRLRECNSHPVDDTSMDVPHICLTMWGGFGVVRNQQACNAVNLPRPKLAPTWGAGMSFAKCHAELTVPNDPNLHHIFDGEEFSRMMRLWTHGYDTYSPSRNMVFHDYKPVPHHWQMDTKPNQTVVQRAANRLKALFGQEGHESNGKFGKFDRGSCRTRDAFYQYSGADPIKQVRSSGRQCKDLFWEPWTQTPAQCKHASRVAADEMAAKIYAKFEAGSSGGSSSSSSSRSSADGHAAAAVSDKNALANEGAELAEGSGVDDLSLDDDDGGGARHYSDAEFRAEAFKRIADGVRKNRLNREKSGGRAGDGRRRGLLLPADDPAAADDGDNVRPGRQGAGGSFSRAVNVHQFHQSSANDLHTMVRTFDVTAVILFVCGILVAKFGRRLCCAASSAANARHRSAKGHDGMGVGFGGIVPVPSADDDAATTAAIAAATVGNQRWGQRLRKTPTKTVKNV